MARCLLVFNFNLGFKWDSYKPSIPIDAIQTVDFLYHSKTYLIESDMFFFFPHVREDQKLWNTVISVLDLERVKKCLRALVVGECRIFHLQTFSHRPRLQAKSRRAPFFSTIRLGICSQDALNQVRSFEARNFPTYSWSQKWGSTPKPFSQLPFP